jgi:hypothetical protein
VHREIEHSRKKRPVVAQAWLVGVESKSIHKVFDFSQSHANPRAPPKSKKSVVPPPEPSPFSNPWLDLSRRKAINNAYEEYVLSVGDFDERIFLGEDAEEEIGTPGGQRVANLSDEMQRRSLKQHVEEVKAGGSLYVWQLAVLHVWQLAVLHVWQLAVHEEVGKRWEIGRSNIWL